MKSIGTVITARGSVQITLIGPGGEIRKRIADNLVVAGGETYIANKMSAADITDLSHLAVGSGSTAPASTDTALEAEIARVGITGPVQGSAGLTNRITISAAFAVGVGTGLLSEAGLFFGTSLFSRVVFAQAQKYEEEAMNIVWTITFNGVQ